MKQIKFPYLKYIVTPPTKKPAQYVYRPVIPIRLGSDDRGITFDALVDSGADECTFPGWIAKMLGHSVYKGEQKIFSGIGGSVLAYLHKTHLILNGNILLFWNWQFIVYCEGATERNTCLKDYSHCKSS